MLIPQAGVSRDPKGNATVMVVGAKSAAEPRVIVANQTIGDKWLVTSGLQPGDQVIVEGLQKVRPGAPVKAAVITAQR
jgi:membrane fusion protein (multidrug efflux system)